MCSDAGKTNSISLYIKGADNNIISVNLHGKYHCKMSSVWFFLDDLQHEKIVQFVSPQFRLKHLSGNALFDVNGNATSPLFASPYPLIIANAVHQVGGLNGMYQWCYEFSGQIEIQMKKIAGNPIDPNDVCVINLELTKLDE
jgi:hypothetical protein